MHDEALVVGGGPYFGRLPPSLMSSWSLSATCVELSPWMDTAFSTP